MNDVHLRVNDGIQLLRKAITVAPCPSVAVLVDPMLEDPLKERSEVGEAQAAGRVVRCPLPPLHPDIASEQRPYLLFAPSEADAERVVNLTIELAIERMCSAASPLGVVHPVAGWFVGHQSPQMLAEALAQEIRVQRPDGCQWPLRLWDPRVNWQLPFTLSLAKWQHLTGALPGWIALSPTGQLRQLSAPGKPSNPGSTSERIYTPTEWDQLEQVGITNMVLAMAVDWDVGPNQTNAMRIRHLIAQCRRMGFPTERDALVFAACGLTSIDGFYLHPNVAQALNQAAHARQSVSSALQGFDDQFWSSLRTPIPSASPCL
ncbi:hypothetical protein KGA65_20475 [Ideonella sp. B7]|uniref:hypothetical protein n=1 Tax=Ideonella benzenivorans TaxID=2831643 RepID=UPI001CEDEB35|nr:hypothetical protein [Ideonella benzenivorans]MCA6218926.1 hypothetical protein [Ideonella benzenivorans]